MRYKITAEVCVDVEIEVDANSVDEANAMFDDHICMTASLIDVPTDKFSVNEDSISSITQLRIAKA